jgi:hypothetical protein
LISFKHDMETNKEMKKNIERFINKDTIPRVGKFFGFYANTMEYYGILNEFKRRMISLIRYRSDLPL